MPPKRHLDEDMAFLLQREYNALRRRGFSHVDAVVFLKRQAQDAVISIMKDIQAEASYTPEGAVAP